MSSVPLKSRPGPSNQLKMSDSTVPGIFPLRFLDLVCICFVVVVICYLFVYFYLNCINHESPYHNRALAVGQFLSKGTF